MMCPLFTTPAICAAMQCSISIDVIPSLLEDPKFNSARQHCVLAILYMLTNCCELMFMEDIKETTIIVKVLVLQARFNPIYFIATDKGTNLKKLEMRRIFNGESLRDSKQALNASAFNQKANPVDYI